MSEFPEMQPFGPGPASHNTEPSAEAQQPGAERTVAAPPAAIEPPQKRSDLAVAILAANS